MKIAVLANNEQSKMMITGTGKADFYGSKLSTKENIDIAMKGVPISVRAFKWASLIGR